MNNLGLLFSSGVFIPYSILLLVILFAGEFPVFWLWTIEYASKYETLKRISDGRGMVIVQNFKSTFLPMWQFFYYILLLALSGILVLYWSSYSRLQKIFTLIYFIASTCVVSAGFYFREHYYIVLLPALGLLTGIFIEFLVKQARQKITLFKSPNIALIILSLLLLFNIYDNRKYYFSYSPAMICQLTYWGNPFDIAQEISKYIHDNTNDTDKIAVLGSEPEICFYANRLSATGYLYTYPLVENQPYNEIMQEQMIHEIEKNKPAYLIICSGWNIEPGSPTTIFDWIKGYCMGYTMGCVADFYKKKGWSIYWNEDMNNQGNQPDGSIVILKRNPDNTP